MYETNPVGYFNVLDEHRHLLLRNEAFEVFPRGFVAVRLEVRCGAIPLNADGDGEQVLHEARLARDLDIDGTVAKAAELPAGDALMVSLNSLHGLFERDELDVGVHGLAGDAIHDDVNRLVRVVQDASVSAEERNHLGALGTEGDLE